MTSNIDETRTDYNIPKLKPWEYITLRITMRGAAIRNHLSITLCGECGGAAHCCPHANLIRARKNIKEAIKNLTPEERGRIAHEITA